MIKTESEFQNLISKIDQLLIKENYSIQARPFAAAKKIAETLNSPVQITSKTNFKENIFSSESLGAHIIDWYQKTYGKKLAIDLSLAHIVVIIKNEPYKLSLPLVPNIHNVNIFFDYSFVKYPKNLNKHQIKGDTFNVANQIENITPMQAQSLNITDINTLLDTFEVYHKLFYDFKFHPIYSKLEFKNEILQDLRKSTNSITSIEPNFGYSKWESLQFTEKLIKSFISYKGDKFPKSHNLIKDLNPKINNLIPNQILEQIECSPSIRYNSREVSLNDAILAHNQSLKVFKLIMEEIMKYAFESKKFIKIKKL